MAYIGQGDYQREVQRLRQIYDETRERYGLKHAINSLSPQARGKGKLSAATGGRPIASPIGAGKGAAPRSSGGGGAATGGIASPLTETAGTRTYHADAAFTSSDGFLTWQYKPAKDITMTDANGAAVVQKLSASF